MNEFWLLDSDTFDNMCNFHEKAQVPAVDELAAYNDTFALVEGMPPNMSVSGDRATISITGILTDVPNFFAQIFGSGNTTYSSIVTAIALAENDPAIKEINLNISSPGGEASAEWVAAMDAIANAKKPVKAFIGKMAASGAFSLAAMADEIVAQNEMSVIGSVGVVRQMFKNSSVINITSTHAPNKRPDPTTPEGQAAIRKEIDPIEKIFIDRLAAGRNTTAEKVIADFGKGGTVLAKEAVKNNMIDSIAGVVAGKSVNTAAVTSGTTQVMEDSKMDLTKLKTEHPSIYAEAVQVGNEQGTKEERDRVEAHLTLGESSGDMKTALAAVTSGDGLTSKYQAKYMSASMNKKASTAHVQDGDDAGDALDGADPKTNTQASDDDDASKLAASIADDYCSHIGYTGDGA